MEKIINKEKFIDEIDTALEGAEQGLPDEVFSFVSSVVPMVNVDLFIQDDAKGVLLAWRNDMDGGGWHIPGGIVRFKETLHSRIIKTAENELNTRIAFDSDPIQINEIFMPYQRRGHFISFLYRCYLPDDYSVCNDSKSEMYDGYLKWHDKLPIKLVEGQKCYQEFLEKVINERKK